MSETYYAVLPVNADTCDRLGWSQSAKPMILSEGDNPKTVQEAGYIACGDDTAIIYVYRVLVSDIGNAVKITSEKVSFE